VIWLSEAAASLLGAASCALCTAAGCVSAGMLFEVLADATRVLEDSSLVRALATCRFSGTWARPASGGLRRNNGAGFEAATVASFGV